MLRLKDVIVGLLKKTRLLTWHNQDSTQSQQTLFLVRGWGLGMRLALNMTKLKCNSMFVNGNCCKQASTHTREQYSSTSVRLTQAITTHAIISNSYCLQILNHTGANLEANENCKQFLNQDSAWLLCSGLLTGGKKNHVMPNVHNLLE